MEHLLQFNTNIYYIHGEDNTIANTLSHLPAEMADEQIKDIDVADSPLGWEHWKTQPSCGAVLAISTDESFLADVHEGYKHDDFCQKLSSVSSRMSNVRLIDDLWYLGDHLMIPRYGTLCKDLF